MADSGVFGSRSGPGSGSCACGSGAAYDACCGPLHRQQRQAATAEELMRSRYAAFAVGELDHVFRTWHPRTRPDDLSPDPGLTWLGLDVVEVVAGGVGDAEGVVAFRARYRTGGGEGGGEGELVERSRFVRRGGRWVYVDGDVT